MWWLFLASGPAVKPVVLVPNARMKRTGAAAGEADEGAPLLSPDPAAVAGRRRQTTRMLQAMTACYAVGWMLVRQTTDQMWLVLTEGDTARTAILRGRLDSASQLVAFVAVPIIAGCSDASLALEPLLCRGIRDNAW